MRIIQFTISPYIITTLVAVVFIIIFFSINSISKNKVNNLNSNRENIKSVLPKLIIVIEGLPLLIYPFVLLANLMHLASFGNVDLPPLMRVVFIILFVLLSSAYPVSYVLSLLFVFRRESRFKLWVSLVPGVHILLTVLLFYFNLFLEQKFPE